ncbi:hypothetical protein, partial [uncultured Succinivibrio sp.]|uniref:hypothetical protein n=1 Tax=uncultured Succinivibrio sp. TaxID=540749 RepID=UPI0025E3C671
MMLYAIKDTKYQGNIFNDNSKAFRESLEAEGYTVAWFDEEPDFYKEWVNTPAADGVIELELSVDQFRDFKLTKLEDATEGFEENKNSQMYFISSIGYKFSGDRRTKDNLKEKIEYFDYLSSDTNGVKTVKFTDFDNIERDLTKEQLELVRSELITNGQNLYNLKTSYRNQLNEAK